MHSSIRFNVIGDITQMPASLVAVIHETQELTKHCTEFDLILGINYGGRDEICRAAKKIAGYCLAKKMQPEELTEELMASFLDTSKWPDPDLLIRTSGELRISNFLLWQSSYTEFHIEKTVWPDFTPLHLLQAILDYQGRERRRGGGG